MLVVFINCSLVVYAHASVGKRAISIAFVHPSVCLFVAYIANNLTTQRPTMPKFGRMVPHLRRDSHNSCKVKGQRSRSPGTLMLTHRAPYLPNGKAYELQTWYTDGGRRPASATGAMTSKVKGQGSKVTWSVWAVLAQWLINRKWMVIVSPKFARGTLTKYDWQSWWPPRSKIKVISSHRLYVSSLPLLKSGNIMLAVLCH